MSKLKEIEDTIIQSPDVEDQEKIDWLINRVKQLTKALERVAGDHLIIENVHQMSMCDACDRINIARKALEGDE